MLSSSRELDVQSALREKNAVCFPIDPVRQKIRDCRFRQILSIPAESAGLDKTYFREFSKILERDSI